MGLEQPPKDEATLEMLQQFQVRDFGKLQGFAEGNGNEWLINLASRMYKRQEQIYSKMKERLTA